MVLVVLPLATSLQLHIKLSGIPHTFEVTMPISARQLVTSTTILARRQCNSDNRQLLIFSPRL